MAASSADTTSRLLTLPRKLRDIIYDYVFPDYTFNLGISRGPGISQTCKQLRAEASAPFDSLTTFKIGRWGIGILGRQLQHLSSFPTESLALMRKVEYLAFGATRYKDEEYNALERKRILQDLEEKMLKKFGVVFEAGVLRVLLDLKDVGL